MDEVDDQAQAENPRHHRKIYRRQEVDLQRYFLDVHERQANGDQFPFNLEELVPTVYSQKVKAIQALTSGYTQDVDYIGFHRMVEDFTVGGGERNIITYHLTAATFEHLVDKNNRAIFEVYRRVFHAGAAEVIDSIAKLKIQLCKPLSTLHSSQEFRERNFASIDFIDKNGDHQPCFEMTRDSFVFLALGMSLEYPALEGLELLNDQPQHVGLRNGILALRVGTHPIQL